MSFLERRVVEQAKQVDLLALFGVPLRRIASTAGGEYAGPCPFCGGKDRLHVQPAQYRWRCRQCGEGEKWSDAIALVMRRDNVSFLEAVERLTGARPMPGAAASRPAAMAPAPPEPDLAARPKDADAWQRRALEMAGEAAHTLWQPNGEEGRRYLMERGFTEATLREWRIGYTPVQRFDRPADWGFAKEGHKVLIPAGVVIPCREGETVHYVKVRRLRPKEGEPKYHRVRGGTSHLFGALADIADRPAVLIVEGELSALAVWQAACDLVAPIATGSTEGCRDPHSIAALTRARTVLVGFDADKSGESQAAYWLKVLPRSKRHRPWWGDPNDLLKVEAVRAWVGCCEAPEAPFMVMARHLRGRGWMPIESEALGETVLFVRDRAAEVPERWQGAVRYTLDELAELQGKDPECLLLVHEIKRLMGGEVLSGCVE